MHKKNPHYLWQGINHKGKKIFGIKTANHASTLNAELSRQGILVKKITKKRYFILSKRLSQTAILHFCQQLATLLKAGISLLQSFDILALNQANPLMNYLINDIKQSIENGFYLSEALNQHAEFFNELVCNLIACGERAGKLDTMLEKVITYKEQIASTKQKLQKAMTYPLIVLFIAFFVTLILMLFVVPQFESLFLSFGAELPELTRITLQIAAFYKNYWFSMIILALMLIYGFIQGRKRSLLLSLTSDKLIFKLPLIGPLMIQAIIARFTRTLAICFGAGLTIVDALDAVKGITGNQWYSKAIEHIREIVITGQPLHFAIANTNLFPAIVIQMVAIGEESGTLETMLAKIADFHDEALTKLLDNLINILEPLIMTLLGLIIGTLVIAMYLPLFKLGSMV